MKSIVKIGKSLVLLLAAALVISFPTTGFAAGVTEAETYVLDREAYGDFLYQYQSPFTLGYAINNQPASPGTAIQAFVFTMYNKESKTHIPAYCIDIGVTAHQGADYRRLNLEDSTYAGNAAGRIRAILQKGFYFTFKPEELEENGIYSVEKHKDLITPRLEELEAASGAVDLTVGEAIAATQAAIWRVVHGPILSYHKFCSSSYVYRPSQTKYSNLCYTDTKLKTLDTINETVKLVYEYLLTLEPVSARQRTVSASSFVELHDPVLTQNADETYDVSVTVTVDVDMAAGDELTLTACLNGGDYTASTTDIQNGSQVVTLTLKNVPAELSAQDVTLTLSGYQTAADYFLFDASGDRGASQTMVGYDNSRLPVYAEVRAEESRVLKIQKGTHNHRPISDIVFDIYHVEDVELYPNPESYPLSDWPNYSVITDSNGFASLNFTQQGLPDGIYLIAERENPKVVAPIAPFYLAVPHTDAGQEQYQITLYPKNVLVEEWVPQAGGIKLIKTDAADSDVLLSGAQFQVYRSATDAELAAGAGVTVPGISGSAVAVSFYDNADMTGEPITSVTTGSDGSACICGLDYGTYYLVETAAPEGYNLLAGAVEIVIDEDSFDAPPLTIENEQGLMLPETGGIGTTVYTLSGALLVCAACVLLSFKMRRCGR